MAVRLSTRPGDSIRQPSLLRSFEMALPRLPKSSISPEVGTESPRIWRMSVVLPAPLTPISPYILPFSSEMFTLLSTCVSPYFFVMFSVLRIVFAMRLTVPFVYHGYMVMPKGLEKVKKQRKKG